MRRNVRNILAELLLDSFNDPQKRATIECLAEFCRVSAARGEAVVPLNKLQMLSSRVGGGARRGVEELVGLNRLLRLRRAGAGGVVPAQDGSQGERGLWLVEPAPEVRAEFSLVCERVRIYAGLVSRMGRSDPRASDRDPLVKAMAEAALCFNAGLFFEAHEHLEHHWAATPKGPVKRFLQGIIQISVGFHQACAGKYDGAINQLGKGLEKTLGTRGEFLGVNCDAFLPKVAAVRAAIVKRGRKRMRPVRLRETPRMPIRGA